jgi:hypothetical protein
VTLLDRELRPLLHHARQPTVAFLEQINADTVQSRDDPLLTPIGRLRVDSRSDGAGTIAVPELSPGSYMVMAYCEPCAATSAGRQLLPVGPFPEPFELVSGKTPSPLSPPAETDNTARVVVVVAAGLAALTGWLLWALRRHRNREPPNRGDLGKGASFAQRRNKNNRCALGNRVGSSSLLTHPYPGCCRPNVRAPYCV